MIANHFFSSFKKGAIIWIFCWCIFSVTGAKGQTEQELKADWVSGCKIIRDIHPAMGLYLKSTQIDSIEAAVLAQNRLKDKRSLYKNLCNLMAKLACVHSNVLPTADLIPENLYPQEGALNIKGGKLIYQKKDANTEFKAVAGRPWKDVYTEIKAVFPGDGPNSTYPEAAAQLNPTYNLRKVIYPHDEIVFTKMNGEQEAIKFNKLPEVLIQGRKPFKREVELFRKRGQSDTVYFSLPSFGATVPYRKINKSLKAIAQNKPDVLIIDLRYNTGGSFPKALQLASEFSDSTIRLKSRQLKRIKLRKHIPILSRFIAKYTVFWSSLMTGGLPKRDSEGFYYAYRLKAKGNKLSYCKKLVLLTGPFTLSAGSMAASYLKHYGNAEVWGTASGGTSSGSQGTHIFAVKLKHSGIKIEIPLSRLEHEIKGTNPGDLIMPDKGPSSIPSAEKMRVEWEKLAID